MRILLKGLNRVRKRLADGRIVIYYYAWKGGPALPGKPGSPEFFEAYVEAVAQPPRTRAPNRGTLCSVLQSYQQSQDFRGLADRTQADYIAKIRLIESKFGDLPLSAFADPRIRALFMAWRDQLAVTSHRQADYAWTVLARVLSWGFNRGLVLVNPCEKGGRVYRGSRVDNVWTEDDRAHFLERAPQHLHLALILAIETGQREGDLLRLPWSAYDGTKVQLQQGKTGRRVVIPAGEPLRVALDNTVRRCPLILTNTFGRPWSADGFRTSWGKTCPKAGIRGLTFHDLRGSAVVRLALADATVPQIATVTGHSLKDVEAILDAHYLGRDVALAEIAVTKLEARTKL